MRPFSLIHLKTHGFRDQLGFPNPRATRDMDRKGLVPHGGATLAVVTVRVTFIGESDWQRKGVSGRDGT